LSDCRGRKREKNEDTNQCSSLWKSIGLPLVSGSLSGESLWNISPQGKEAGRFSRRLGHFPYVCIAMHWLFGMRWFLSTPSYFGAKVTASTTKTDWVSRHTECSICIKSCPFEVDVLEKMRQAVELFEREV
jgi:hypothetical protein